MKVGSVVLTYNSSDTLLAVLRGLAPQCAADPTLSADVNKLTHLLYWPGAPGRLQDRSWKGIRRCDFGVWYRDFEAVNGFDARRVGAVRPPP